MTNRHKNAVQRNTRIGSESILASCWVSTSVDVKATQCLASYCEPAFTCYCKWSFEVPRPQGCHAILFWSWAGGQGLLLQDTDILALFQRIKVDLAYTIKVWFYWWFLVPGSLPVCMVSVSQVKKPTGKGVSGIQQKSWWTLRLWLWSHFSIIIMATTVAWNWGCGSWDHLGFLLCVTESLHDHPPEGHTKNS